MRSSLLREGIQPRLLGSMLFQLLLRSPLLDVHLPLPPRLLEGGVPVPIALVFQSDMKSYVSFGSPVFSATCSSMRLRKTWADSGDRGAVFRSVEGPAMPRRVMFLEPLKAAFWSRDAFAFLCCSSTFFVSSSDSSNLKSRRHPLPFSCQAFFQVS